MRSNRFLAFAHKPTAKEDDTNPNVKTAGAEVSNTDMNKGALKAPVTPKAKRKKSDGAPSPKTQSFDPLWAGSLANHFPNSVTMEDDVDTSPIIEPHTLILGTHPSIASLSTTQYYGHPMNAFWWIAGDCLGFRRDKGTKINGEPYKFSSHLRHSNIIPYEAQVKRLIQSGFALWDLIGICRRPGSLDQDITDETPNDIQSFCRDHPSIRRIVFTNGFTACKLFSKHNRDWLMCGQLVHSPDPTSTQTFGRKIGSVDGASNVTPKNQHWTSDHQIVLVSAISVSPAAARYTYLDKRTFWDDNVYKPGLELFSK